MSKIVDQNVYKSINPIVLNQTNVVSNGGNNNIYRYTFPGSVDFDSAQIAISSIQMFYSWVNISPSLNNNTISIIFPLSNGGGGTTTATVSITIPTGSYSVSDLNSYLQSVMITNNYYLVNSNSQNVYYATITENAVRYAIQLDLYPVPTTLPTGWSQPSGNWGSVGLPSVGDTPQFVIPATNMTTLLGFTAATYPSSTQTTTQSFISSSTPQVSPVSSVTVGCNLVNNKLANPSSIIYSFSPSGVSYGSLIQSNAYQYSWVDIINGPNATLDITFYDQNFQALQIIDTNIVILLLIRA